MTDEFEQQIDALSRAALAPAPYVDPDGNLWVPLAAYAAETERLRDELVSQTALAEAWGKDVERLREALDLIAHWRGEFQTADAGRMRAIAREAMEVKD